MGFQITDLRGIRRIGKTITFENGGLVAMVQEVIPSISQFATPINPHIGIAFLILFLQFLTCSALPLVQRATLALVMLCEHEEYRRKAFRIGLPELMLHQLQHGKTIMAMEGAAQAICLLCLLNDRNVIRVRDR